LFFNRQVARFKMLKSLSVFVFLPLFATNLINSEASSAAKAIADIVKQFAVDRSIHFDLIVYRCAHENLVDEIAALVETPIRVRKLEYVDLTFSIYQSAILFLNNTTRFIEFHTRTVYVNGPLKEEMHFFVYINNTNREDFDQFFSNFGNVLYLFKNTYFMMDSEGESFIELSTFMLFQQPNCVDPNFVTINRFSKATGKWRSRSKSLETSTDANCWLVIQEF
jgi:hypothetical protein